MKKTRKLLTLLLCLLVAISSFGVFAEAAFAVTKTKTTAQEETGKTTDDQDTSNQNPGTTTEETNQNNSGTNGETGETDPSNPTEPTNGENPEGTNPDGTNIDGNPENLEGEQGENPEGTNPDEANPEKPSNSEDTENINATEEENEQENPEATGVEDDLDTQEEIPEETWASYVPLIKFYDGEIDTTLLYPLAAKATVSCEFGSVEYLHPTGHKGIDLAIAYGTPVLAAEAGTVTRAGYYGDAGNCIYIDHGDGLQTRYAHMSELNVQVGDEVKRGQQIGRVGSTGYSTGPHLHFEVLYKDQYANPAIYLDAFMKSVEIDGVIVTVETKPGVFPEGWQLSVENVSEGIKQFSKLAIGTLTEANRNIAGSYMFEIKVLDSEGNEITQDHITQGIEAAIEASKAEANGAIVTHDGATLASEEPAIKISFAAPESDDKNLTPSVYHITVKAPKEEEKELDVTALLQAKAARRAQAKEEEIGAAFIAEPVATEPAEHEEKKPVDNNPFVAEQLALIEEEPEEPTDVENDEKALDAVAPDTLAVAAKELSYYVVEFTYNEKEYALETGSVIKLQDLMAELEIQGDARDIIGISGSNPEAFEVIWGKEEGASTIQIIGEDETTEIPVNDPEGTLLYLASFAPINQEENGAAETKPEDSVATDSTEETTPADADAPAAWLNIVMKNGITYHIIITDALPESTDDENVDAAATGTDTETPARPEETAEQVHIED